MKGNIKSFICGMLVMSVISCAAAYAVDAWQTINVLPNTIKVVVDGKVVQEDNFLYNDTTYLPIRAVSEALGKDVQYDTETSIATISEKKEDDNVEPVTSKYIPPAEYINDTLYVAKENKVYYVSLTFIGQRAYKAGYELEYDRDTQFFSIKKDGKSIYSAKEVSLENEAFGGIPYDQFVEEIEPLLK